jgi:hypothetical protein
MYKPRKIKVVQGINLALIIILVKKLNVKTER